MAFKMSQEFPTASLDITHKPTHIVHLFFFSYAKHHRKSDLETQSKHKYTARERPHQTRSVTLEFLYLTDPNRSSANEIPDGYGKLTFMRCVHYLALSVCLDYTNSKAVTMSCCNTTECFFYLFYFIYVVCQIFI